MLKIAILSDSHRKTTLTKDAVDMLKDKGAKYLIHAGDLEQIENLDILKNSGLIYTSVFGNNDYGLVKYSNDYNINQEPYYFKIKELKLKLMHVPTFMAPDSDIIIFGHTHVFKHEFTNNTLYLNPGEICAREKDQTECVLLSVTDEKYIIEFNYKKPNDTIWQSKMYEYERE